MQARLLGKIPLFLFIFSLLTIIAYQSIDEKIPATSENIGVPTALSIPIAKSDLGNKSPHPDHSQYPPDTEMKITSDINLNTVALDVTEPYDITIDSDHTIIRLPSEQPYSPEYRDTLISSFRNGTMTPSQKRDFDTALNHPQIPVEDKILLNKEFMLAFQQRKITPEQIFSQLH